jgi:hypothetical protein
VSSASTRSIQVNGLRFYRWLERSELTRSEPGASEKRSFNIGGRGLHMGPSCRLLNSCPSSVYGSVESPVRGCGGQGTLSYGSARRLRRPVGRMPAASGSETGSRPSAVKTKPSKSLLTEFMKAVR